MILEDILHQTLEIEQCERISRGVWCKHRMLCPLENIAKENGFLPLDAHQSPMTHLHVFFSLFASPRLQFSSHLSPSADLL